MGSGYTRETVKTCDFSAILGGRVIREVGLYASMYGNNSKEEGARGRRNTQGL